MSLKQRVIEVGKRPMLYINDTLPTIKFNNEDDINDIICLLMTTVYNNMPDVFLKLVDMVEVYPQLLTNNEYAYYYHLSLASFFKHHGEYDKSIEKCLLSNDIAYKLGDHCGIAQTDRFLSTIYFMMDDFENASYYCKEAIKEVSHCDDISLMSNIYNLYGAILLNQKDYNKAIVAYENALKVLKQTNDYKTNKQYFIILLNIGEAYIEKDDFESAKSFYDDAINLASLNNYDYTFGDVLEQFVDFFKRNDDYKSACLYYDKILDRDKKMQKSNIESIRKSDDSQIKEELSQMKSLRESNNELTKVLDRLKDMTSQSDIQSFINLQERLSNALDDDEIVTFYQSRYSLRQQKSIGCEALIRLKDGSSFISPTDFIHLIEDAPIIIPLSERVIAQSISFCKDVVDKYDPNFVVSINIAPYQLENQELAKYIQGQLVLHHLDARHIEIEITERNFINQSNKSYEQLLALKDLGVRISLDDFGTGYSSLAYINNFDFDNVKVDRQLLQNLNEPKALELLTGIIALFKTLNIDVTIEGVETGQIEEILLLNDCDCVQGFYYDNPRPADDFIRSTYINNKTATH